MIFVVFTTNRKIAYGADGSTTPARFNKRDADDKYIFPIFSGVSGSDSIPCGGMSLAAVVAFIDTNDNAAAVQECSSAIGVHEVKHIESGLKDYEAARQAYFAWVKNGKQCNVQNL